MGYGKYSNLDSLVVRISRLNAAGMYVPLDADGALIFCCEAKVGIQPTIETGTTLNKTGYCVGQACNSWDTPDRISGYEGQFTVCNLADEFNEMVGLSAALSVDIGEGEDPEVIVGGSLFYETGSCPSPDTNTIQQGVTVEVWTRPVLCKKQTTDAEGVLMWRKTVIPWAYNFTQTDMREIGGDAFPDYVFSFKMRPPNPLWGDGPFNDNDLLDPTSNDLAPALDWTYAEYWTTQAPPACPAGVFDYLALPAAA